MENHLSLKVWQLDIWLLEQLRNAPKPGLTLEQLKALWKANPRHKGELSRETLTRHRKIIEGTFGIIINTPNKKHYQIANPEMMGLDSLANDLMASLQCYLFLDEYRDIRDAIQPQQIWAGLEYLSEIGDAIRHRNKLRITYQKFSDEAPYTAIVHPYCLKASLGRWYILAVKEGDDAHPRTFALDRIRHLHLVDEKYKVNRSINVKNHFRDAFGIWVEPDKYPVQDITVTVPQWVAKYWRTLPLHDSQREVAPCRFTFHLAPTPDFLGELRRWQVQVDDFD